MPHFVSEMLHRTLAAILAAKGTTMLGGIIVPAAFFILQWLIKRVRRKRAAVDREDIIAGLSATVIIWIALFGFFALWVVPQQIRVEAAPNVPRFDDVHLLVPKGWDNDYFRRKQHRQQEDFARSKGWITKERQEQITAKLRANVSSACLLGYVTGPGTVDPRQIDPIKQALAEANWKPMVLVARIGLEVPLFGAPEPAARPPLDVTYPPSERECALVVCKALGSPCMEARKAQIVVLHIRHPE
jgi:hypothetical protein